MNFKALFSTPKRAAAVVACLLAAAAAAGIGIACVIGGNTILPLIYYSFKDPLVALWVRFCGRYGNLALVRNTETLYSFLKKRDADGAICWINAYLERIISGSQQIYEP